MAAMSGTQKIEDPEKAREVYSQVAHFEIPEDSNLDVRVALLKTWRPSFIEFWDKEKFSESETRLYFGYWNAFFTSQVGTAELNRNNMSQETIDRILGKIKEFEKTDESLVNWMIHGEERRVIKTKYVRTIENEDGSVEESDYQMYHCNFDVNPNTITIAFLTKIPNVNMQESKVQGIFESYQPLASVATSPSPSETENPESDEENGEEETGESTGSTG